MCEEKENPMMALCEEIAEKYGDGGLIPHEWLRKKCGFEELNIKDFESTKEFLAERDAQQFAYMSAVEQIRLTLLSDFEMFMKNDRGNGYIILQPDKQVKYGYDYFNDKMKKYTRLCELIMTKVRPVDREQQRKDRDTVAKFQQMQIILDGVRKNH